MEKNATTEATVTLTLAETDQAITAMSALLKADGGRYFTDANRALAMKLEHAAQATRQAFWNEQYRAEQSVTEKRIAACRYCKTAQKRGKPACRKHREESRLNYVTSPVSEAYWAN